MPKLVQGERPIPSSIELAPAKRRLFEVALAKFAEEGYHAVSIRDIAAALGLQSSAIYSHVDSKPDLLFELSSIGHRMHNDALQAALLDAGREPRDQLTAIVTAHVAHHIDYPSMARLANRELRALPPDKLDVILAIRNASERMFIDILERGSAMGAFDVEDSFLAAKAIAGMALRVPEWLTAETPRTREQIIDRYVGFALRLVVADPARRTGRTSVKPLTDR